MAYKLIIITIKYKDIHTKNNNNKKINTYILILTVKHNLYLHPGNNNK